MRTQSRHSRSRSIGLEILSVLGRRPCCGVCHGSFGRRRGTPRAGNRAVQPRAMGIEALAVAPAVRIVPGLTIEGKALGAAAGRPLGRLAATGLVWAWLRALFATLRAGHSDRQLMIQAQSRASDRASAPPSVARRVDRADMPAARRKQRQRSPGSVLQKPSAPSPSPPRRPAGPSPRSRRGQSDPPAGPATPLSP
jgi:hypothetical protein